MATLCLVADALEGTSAAEAEQRLELRSHRRADQRLVTVEDLGELARGHVRGQRQVDEQALVALTAPAIEPSGRVLVERPVARAEQVVELGQRGERLGDRELGAISEPREVGHSADSLVDQGAETLLELEALGPLVVHRPEGAVGGR